MDEKPYQLLGESREPLPMRKGSNQKIDSEYVIEGTCSIFIFTEPLGGVRHVNVRKQRTAVSWAEEIQYLVDIGYPEVEKSLWFWIISIHTQSLHSSEHFRLKRHGG